MCSDDTCKGQCPFTLATRHALTWNIDLTASVTISFALAGAFGGERSRSSPDCFQASIDDAVLSLSTEKND